MWSQWEGRKGSWKRQLDCLGAGGVDILRGSDGGTAAWKRSSSYLLERSGKVWL